MMFKVRMEYRKTTIYASSQINQSIHVWEFVVVVVDEAIIAFRFHPTHEQFARITLDRSVFRSFVVWVQFLLSLTFCIDQAME